MIIYYIKIYFLNFLVFIKETPNTEPKYLYSVVPRMAEEFLAEKQGFPYMTEYLNWPNLNWPNFKRPNGWGVKWTFAHAHLIRSNRPPAHLPAHSDHPPDLTARSNNPLDPFWFRPFLFGPFLLYLLNHFMYFLAKFATLVIRPIVFFNAYLQQTFPECISCY